MCSQNCIQEIQKLWRESIKSIILAAATSAHYKNSSLSSLPSSSLTSAETSSTTATSNLISSSYSIDESFISFLSNLITSMPASLNPLALKRKRKRKRKKKRLSLAYSQNLSPSSNFLNNLTSTSQLRLKSVVR